MPITKVSPRKMAALLGLSLPIIHTCSIIEKYLPDFSHQFRNITRYSISGSKPDRIYAKFVVKVLRRRLEYLGSGEEPWRKDCKKAIARAIKSIERGKPSCKDHPAAFKLCRELYFSLGYHWASYCIRCACYAEKAFYKPRYALDVFHQSIWSIYDKDEQLVEVKLQANDLIHEIMMA